MVVENITIGVVQCQYLEKYGYYTGTAKKEQEVELCIYLTQTSIHIPDFLASLLFL